jgi:hypothetical protein
MTSLYGESRMETTKGQAQRYFQVAWKYSWKKYRALLGDFPHFQGEIMMDLRKYDTHEENVKSDHFLKLEKKNITFIIKI